MTVVVNKAQNYRLWRAGAYGNKLRAWRTVDAWRRSGYADEVVLRYVGTGGGGRCAYHLRPEDVDAEVAAWVADGADPGAIMVNEQAPGVRTVLQGELFNGVMLGGSVYPFLFTLVPRPMREALAIESRHAFGLRTLALLEHFMTPSSYADLRVVMDLFPDHVIEVSVFANNLGDTPGRNALVWEVRRY